MRRKKKETEYYGGRIKALTEIVADKVYVDPTLGGIANRGRLHATIAASVEGYGKRDTCFNCKRSMKITMYEADLHDALLLYAMARAVRSETRKGVPFTEANKVHLPTLSASHATIKRSTKCDYLGFIKQPDNWRGTGYWLLTAWGWKALRDEPVPDAAYYWEGKLIRRSEKLVRISEFFHKHRDLVEAAIKKQKAVKADHRAIFADYDASQWTEYGGNITDEGKLAV